MKLILLIEQFLLPAYLLLHEISLTHTHKKLSQNLKKARFNQEKPRRGKENLIYALYEFNRVLVRFN